MYTCDSEFPWNVIIAEGNDCLDEPETELQLSPGGYMIYPVSPGTLFIPHT